MKTLLSTFKNTGYLRIDLNIGAVQSVFYLLFLFYTFMLHF